MPACLQLFTVWHNRSNRKGGWFNLRKRCTSPPSVEGEDVLPAVSRFATRRQSYILSIAELKCAGKHTDCCGMESHSSTSIWAGPGWWWDPPAAEQLAKGGGENRPSSCIQPHYLHWQIKSAGSVQDYEVGVTCRGRQRSTKLQKEMSSWQRPTWLCCVFFSTDLEEDAFLVTQHFLSASL